VVNEKISTPPHFAVKLLNERKKSFQFVVASDSKKAFLRKSSERPEEGMQLECYHINRFINIFNNKRATAQNRPLLC
jgi:hypothetical protein